MGWQPVAYPVYSDESVRVTNQLSQFVTGTLQLPMGQQVYSAELAAVGDDYSACIRLECDIGDGALSVYLNASTLNAVLHNVVPVQHFRTLADLWQLALLEAAIAPLVEALQEQCGEVLALGQVNSVTESPPANSLRLVIQAAEIKAAWSIVIKIENTLPPAIMEWFEQSAQRAVARDYGWLPLPVKLEVGYTSLPLSEVKSLRSGDVIMSDIYYLSDGQVRININESFFCFAEMDGSHLTVQTQLDGTMEKNLSAPEDANDTVTPDQDKTIANLPIDVVFVAGRLKITLNDLQHIQTGYVFDLQRNSDRHIEICANGVKIGSGELVEIDGRAGVRVLECE